ncbi:MAG: mechanosensitive ion channel [Cyanobacteriota bacterium]|nr:mechanosensitive ion channel [Cyanobacteriota bacterium]
MNRFLRFPSLRSFTVRIAVAAITFLLAVVPVLAADNPKAPIILDGGRLFEVSQSGGYTAQERADDANRVLKQKVTATAPPIPVKLDNSQTLPIIKVDGSHLLTVTEQDAPPGRTAKEQAEIWAAQLEGAIQLAQKQRSPNYISKAIVLSAGFVLLVIAFTWALGWIWHRWLQPMLPREVRDTEETRQRLTVEVGVGILLAGIRGSMWLFTALYITNLFPQTRELSRKVTDTLVASLVSELIPLGKVSYSVLDLLILLGLFTALIIVARAVKKLLRSRVLRFTGLSRGSQETVAQIATYGIIFFGTMVVLQLWGLDLSSLTIFASVLGVGIGLGLQGIAKEFISGLVLIFERPIKVGDFVNVGDLTGTVERISVRSTEIRTLDEVSIIIPNSRFLEGEVVNWTHHSPVSRLKLPVSVAYGSNLTIVRCALIDAAKEHADVLSEPAPRVFFEGLGESGLNFNLMVWIAEPPKQFRIKSDLYFRIEAILRHRHIEIPFPQQDLHVRSGSLPLEVSPQLTESLAQLSNGLAKWLEKQSTATSQESHNNGRSNNGQY